MNYTLQYIKSLSLAERCKLNDEFACGSLAWDESKSYLVRIVQVVEHGAEHLDESELEERGGNIMVETFYTKKTYWTWGCALKTGQELFSDYIILGETLKLMQMALQNMKDVKS